MRMDITGGFEVEGESYNERRVIDFCAESGLCVDNTYFTQKFA